MEPTAKSTGSPSTPGGNLLRKLLSDSSPPPTTREVQCVIKEVTVDATKELSGEERTILLEIIDKAAPRVLVTGADVEFVAKLGKICSAISQLPKSTGSLGGLKKSGEIAFATGGMTDSWRAVWGDKAVALKAFRVFKQHDLPKAKKILCEVGPIWKRLHHENVLPFYGAETKIFDLALVYEWSNNGNIMDYLKSNTDAPKSKLLLQVAKGLQFLHSLDIIHGNVKGANVLISESGNAQVCDYGLTAFTSGTSFAIAATPGPVGSSRWAAPEILNPPNSSNPSIASKPADVFAFAMLAVEVYTGELPYGDVENIWPLLLKVIDGKRPDKPKTNEITKNIWKSIEKCWSQDPKRRPGIDQVVSTWKRLVNCDANHTLVSTTSDGADGKAGLSNISGAFRKLIRLLLDW